jgi:hypothetical protein
MLLPKSPSSCPLSIASGEPFLDYTPELLAVVKLPADMDASEQAAAADAAAMWRQEQQQQQQLLSQLATRAEEAEVCLAELRLGGADIAAAEGDGGAPTVAGISTGRLKTLTGEILINVNIFEPPVVHPRSLVFLWPGFRVVIAPGHMKLA